MAAAARAAGLLAVALAVPLGAAPVATASQEVAPPGWPALAGAPEAPGAGPEAAPEAAPAVGPGALVPHADVRAAAATSPVVTAVGSGFGHSVGMSQYGAQAMAQEGRSATEILTHYFTGTRPAAWPAVADDAAEVAVNLF